MRIAIGSDHRGFAAKRAISQFLQQAGHEVLDIGCHDDGRCDYPQFAVQTSRTVVDGKAERGVLICGSGLGMSMAANKVRGVRAAAVFDPMMAEMSRRHHDVNVLCLSADMTSPNEMVTIVETWLRADFEGGRHQRRIDALAEIERSQE